MAELLVTGGTVVTLDARRRIIRDGALMSRDGGFDPSMPFPAAGGAR